MRRLGLCRVFVLRLGALLRRLPARPLGLGGTRRERRGGPPHLSAVLLGLGSQGRDAVLPELLLGHGDGGRRRHAVLPRPLLVLGLQASLPRRRFLQRRLRALGFLRGGVARRFHRLLVHA